MTADDTIRPKRSRNAERTSTDILRAAATAFSHEGYSQAGIREIAATAGINPALVRRYFGSKEGLYSAALASTLNLDELVKAGHSGFGAHVAAHLCKDEERTFDSTSMMVLATADPRAKEITEELLEAQIIAPLAAWLGPPRAETRAALITVLCTGFVIYRHLLPLSPLKSANESQAAEWLGTALQAVVNGDDFSDPPTRRRGRQRVAAED
jgi:AcrR family transcriptional regulator